MFELIFVIGMFRYKHLISFEKSQINLTIGPPYVNSREILR